MEKLVYEGETYSTLFRTDENTLMKYSHLDMEAAKLLMTINLDYLNNPLKAEYLNKKEKEHYNKRFDYKIKMFLPFLKEFIPLFSENITNTMYTESILKLIRRILLLSKDMHSNDIFHSDMNPKNIMINRNLDIVFIDLDLAIIGKYVSICNPCYNDKCSLDEKKRISRMEDKKDILRLLLHYLVNANFRKNDLDYINLSKIYLPDEIRKEFEELQKSICINDDYYFIDIIDELLKKGYESPTIIKRKVMKYSWEDNNV